MAAPNVINPAVESLPAQSFFAQPIPAQSIPSRMRNECDFTQLLIKVQRATHLIASTRDCESLLNRIVSDIASTIGNVEVCVWLRDDDSGEMILQGVRGCTHFAKGHQLRLEPKNGMVGWTATSGKMRYAPDVLQDEYYVVCEAATRSEVTVPLLNGTDVIGVLCVSHEQLNAFSDDQLTVLEALAGHIAIALENARAFAYEREERERLERESAEARIIQQALFQKPLPVIPGFAFETAWHPAGAVAGDWFDFIDLGNHRYGVTLADVSGKGMSAALLMSATRALLRTIAPLHTSPAQTLGALNRSLIDDFPSGKFVTMVYGVLDTRARTFTAASAGHPSPLLINGHASFLNLETGFPLGLGVSAYPECTVPLPPGTNVLLYTDGITEAATPADEEYGPARLLQHFSARDACINGLIAEVQHFSAGSDRPDDATAVLIRSL
jgi:sigma-B regulation protein RsbU (phosphoserine phosphatase)